MDKKFIVEAKLSTFLGQDTIKILIEEPGKRVVGTLKVSDKMEATLSGGSAFEVSLIGSKEQPISDKETTNWTWQVTPKRPGQQFLVLSFDAVIILNGKEERRTITTFKHRIDVEVGWPETGGDWLEFIKKTGENASWIWATLLLPCGVGVWAWIKRKTRPQEPTTTDRS